MIHVCKFLDVNLEPSPTRKTIHYGFHANSLNQSFRIADWTTILYFFFFFYQVIYFERVATLEYG